MTPSMRAVLTVFVTGAALGPLAACPGPTCGADGAPADGVTAIGGGATLTYTGLVAGINNDCPDPAAPAGVVSLSIHGTHVGSGFPFTLCVPRPDRLPDGPQALGPGLADVQLIDVDAQADGCTWTLTSPRVASGTITAAGSCDDGAHPDGFALTVAIDAQVIRDCGTPETLTVQLRGQAAVAGPPQ